LSRRSKPPVSPAHFEQRVAEVDACAQPHAEYDTTAGTSGKNGRLRFAHLDAATICIAFVICACY
jgi:hypothetical protein